LPYELEPRYPVNGNAITRGFGPLAEELSALRPAVVAIDGPAAIDWGAFMARLGADLRARGVAVRAIDARTHLAPFAEIVARTESQALRDDPVFATTFAGTLDDLLRDGAPHIDTQDGALTVVFGPGSALATSGTVWYVDLPKRLALRAVGEGRGANLGQPDGAAGTARRLLFVDWPVEDRHRRQLAGRWARYVDASEPASPRSIDGASLRDTLRSVAVSPFRTRPAFLPQPWGGRWASDVLGASDPGANAGLGYELVAPESGILLGDAPSLEVALDVLLAYEAMSVLGAHAVQRFGTAFPIRFDYLDTVGGGDLSVHCHPRSDYMRTMFGVPITQHETYYVMVTRPDARIFLGLREDADEAQFREAATRSAADGTSLDIERFVNTFPARPHQLYLIPAGTPHGSGEGNVVLEISATPYLYSLRFYDWLREDLRGGFRPVQLDHAFANLALERRGDEVVRLVPSSSVVRQGAGHRELDLGAHPDLFFAVRRLEFEDAISDKTDGRFLVLNLVDGDEVSIRTPSGREHPLRYAETVVIPASVGDFELRRARGGPAKVVKAFVR
jgi:mannose-6-phosphate isomerase class I